MARPRSRMLLRMNSASSVRRRIAGASVLVAAVAGCAGTPSALAGTSPALKELAPARGLDSATAKRLAELEQAAALKCAVGLPGQDVDPKACTPTDPAAAIGAVGGGPSLGGGPARDGGGIIDVDALGCRGQQGPVRPGQAAMDGEFEGVSTTQLRRDLAEAKRAEGEYLNILKDLRTDIGRLRDHAAREHDNASAVGAALETNELGNWTEMADENHAKLERIQAELERRRREAPNSSPNARRPVPPRSSLPKPDDAQGGPNALACATMEKARFKTPEELKQAETPMLQNLCADPAKDGGVQGVEVDCGPAEPKATQCVVDGTPTCVERTSPLANVRRVPGLKLEVPGVVGCADRRNDCG